MGLVKLEVPADNPGPQLGMGCVCRSEAWVGLSLIPLGWEGEWMWFGKWANVGQAAQPVTPWATPVQLFSLWASDSPGANYTRGRTPPTFSRKSPISPVSVPPASPEHCQLLF